MKIKPDHFCFFGGGKGKRTLFLRSAQEDNISEDNSRILLTKCNFDIMEYISDTFYMILRLLFMLYPSR